MSAIRWALDEYQWEYDFGGEAMSDGMDAAIILTQEIRAVEAKLKKAERERDEARMALKSVAACEKFDCEDGCRELIAAALEGEKR